MDLTEKLKRSQKVYEGKLLHVYRDVVTLSSGAEEVREIIRHPGAAVIAARRADGRFVLVRQYRHPIGRETLEFPAGRMDPGEDPLDCARRELEEETGYSAAGWRELFTMHPAPGYTDELLHIYLAEDLQDGQNHPDDDEQVAVTEAGLDELLEWIREGKITDSKTLSAILYLKTFGP